MFGKIGPRSSNVSPKIQNPEMSTAHWAALGTFTSDILPWLVPRRRLLLAISGNPARYWKFGEGSRPPSAQPEPAASSSVLVLVLSARTYGQVSESNRSAIFPPCNMAWLCTSLQSIFENRGVGRYQDGPLTVTRLRPRWISMSGLMRVTWCNSIDVKAGVSILSWAYFPPCRPLET